MPAAEHPIESLHGYLDYRPVDPALDRRIARFVLIIAALFLLDIITTYFILLQGGIEMNPAMAGMVANPLIHYIVKAGALLLISLVLLVAEMKVRGTAVILSCAIITLYVFVIVHNMLELVPHLAGF